MTRDEVITILALPQERAIRAILALAEKADKYDQIIGDVSPTTPSGMQPVYKKPSAKGRKKRPGRKKGHPGVSRLRPEEVDHFKEHTLQHCPRC